MKRSRGLILVAAGILLVSFFAWEWYLSPTAKVERFLQGLAGAAEDKNTEELLASFSSTYSDFRGLDYEAVAELIERAFDQVDRLHVTIEGIRVDFDTLPTTAAFDLTVVAVRGDEHTLLVGQPMQGERLRVALEKESGNYRISKVEKTASEYSSEPPGAGRAYLLLLSPAWNHRCLRDLLSGPSPRRSSTSALRSQPANSFLMYLR